jgi:hypothetical protein
MVEVGDGVHNSIIKPYNSQVHTPIITLNKKNPRLCYSAGERIQTKSSQLANLARPSSQFSDQLPTLQKVFMISYRETSFKIFFYNLYFKLFRDQYLIVCEVQIIFIM